MKIGKTERRSYNRTGDAHAGINPTNRVLNMYAKGLDHFKELGETRNAFCIVSPNESQLSEPLEQDTLVLLPASLNTEAIERLGFTVYKTDTESPIRIPLSTEDIAIAGKGLKSQGYEYVKDAEGFCIDKEQIFEVEKYHGYSVIFGEPITWVYEGITFTGIPAYFKEDLGFPIDRFRTRKEENVTEQELQTT